MCVCVCVCVCVYILVTFEVIVVGTLDVTPHIYIYTSYILRLLQWELWM